MTGESPVMREAGHNPGTRQEVKAMANTVTLYSVSCTKARHYSELYNDRFSLRDWGADTEDYKGYDDGGKQYILPDGYEVAECAGGTLEFYNAAGKHCPLTTLGNTPVIVDIDKPFPGQVYIKRAE